MGKSKSFGKEIGLMHEVILRAKRYGADGSFLTQLANNQDLCRYVVDLVNVQHARNERSVIFQHCVATIICLSQTEKVGLLEAYNRVSPFGNHATYDTLCNLCRRLDELRDTKGFKELQYPIVAISQYFGNILPDKIPAIDLDEHGLPVIKLIPVEKMRIGNDWEICFPPKTSFCINADPRLPHKRAVLGDR